MIFNGKSEIFQNISLQNSFNRKAIFLPPPTYVLFIRSLLEQSATVWHSSLSLENIIDWERIHESACRIMPKDNYKGYKNASNILNLLNLAPGRENLYLNFTLKCTKNAKTKHKK